MENSLTRANEFLANWNMRAEDLASYFRPLKPSESMLLVGSISEGLANPVSDIDLLIIGDGTLDQGTVVSEPGFDESAVRLPGGQEVNFEYWNAKEIELLHLRLEKAYELIMDPSLLERAYKFNEREVGFLHRLRVGVVVANPENVEFWRERLQLDSLQDYLVFQSLSFHFAYREDTIGHIRYDDSLSALCTFRMAMDALAGAMLASIGETNAFPKWRPRLLQRHQDVLGEDEVKMALRYIFPDSSVNVETLLPAALSFADTAIGELIGRRPMLIPLLLELGDRVSFVKQTRELPQ
jgi:predicted nucleotidyltransferase